MSIWKFFHILTMFTSITLMFAAAIFFDRLRRSGDVAAIRRHGPFIKRVEDIGVALFFVGVGFGLIAAWRIGFGLTARWLIAAYVLVTVAVIVGGGIEAPIEGRILKAVAANAGDDPTPELRAMLDSPALTVLTWVSAALYVAIIYVMVEKPFT